MALMDYDEPATRWRVAFGDRLREARLDLGLSQGDLAERIGIIQALVSKYERGVTEPKASMVARLADGLGVSADDLLGVG